MPIKSRGNHTPDELFLYLDRTQVKNYTGIRRTGKKKVPKLANAEELLKDKEFMKHVNLFREFIMQKQHKIYQTSEYAKSLARGKINSKHKVGLINFQKGEWVLMSIKDTPKMNNKLKQIWQGPFLITDVVSSHVYQLESLAGKKYIVHASRMWFYNTENFVPDQYVKNLAKLNWGHFEVDKIEKIFLSTEGEIFVTVKWFGFKETTYEPVENLLDGAYLLLQAFINKNKKTLDENVVLSINKLIRKRIKEVDTMHVVLKDVGKLKMKEKEIEVECKDKSYLHGWTKQEIECLIRLMKKFPLGTWDVYVEHLPAKSKSQIISKIQRLTGFQQVSGFKGKYIHMLTNKNNMNYIVKTDRIDKVLIPVPNDHFRITKNKSNIEIEKTFDRNLVETKQFKDVKSKCLKILEEHGERFIKLIDNEGSKKIPVCDGENMINIFNEGEEKVEFGDNRFNFKERSNNEYIIKDKELNLKFSCYIPPTDVTVKNVDIGNATETYNKLALVLADPPWNHLSSTPTRGPIISYDTLRLDDIYRHLKQFIGTPVMCLWVVNAVLVKVINWIEENDYELCFMFDSIKITKEKTFKKSLGMYLQHSKDLLLVCVHKRFKKEEVLNVNLNLEDFTMSEYIRASEKPKRMNVLLKKWVKVEGKALELYARNNNVMPEWIALGNELDTQLTLKCVFINKSELDRKYLVNYE